MSHIRHGDGPDRIGDLFEFGIVVVSWVGRVATEDDFRLRGFRDFHQFLKIDAAIFLWMGLVPYKVEYFPHMRDRVTVGEVPSMGKIHSQYGVSGF
ncbi:MAG: hypothetical protein ACD_28C00218G0002 [uncultured bacterium]|nr:MAG: hypothetical protein ACD_28C00218G0002 [uncultured bacterium]